MTTLESLRKSVQDRRAVVASLRSQIDDLSLRREVASHRADVAVATQKFVDDVASTRRSKITAAFERLVNEAVHAVYGEAISIRLHWSFKRNRPALVFQSVRRLPNGEEVVRDTGAGIDGTGGGVADLVSVLVRVLFIELRPGSTAKFLALDEPFRCMGQLATQAAEFLRSLCDERGWQVLVVTHDDALAEVADVAYTVEHDGEKSVIRKV